MNRRQFFGAVAGASAVATLPADIDLPVSGIAIARRGREMNRLSRLRVDGVEITVNAEADLQRLHEWAVIEDEPEVYVSPRVATVDRLLHLAEVIE